MHGMHGDKTITVLYGSQTGNAEELAMLLWKQLKIRGFSGPVLPMDDYDVTNLILERFAIFICSTTGIGEEPDNMKKFWRFLLRKSLPENSLKNLKFAVLGLGDSSYEKFNFVGKKLNRRLSQLGGTQLLEIGLCDYQHDLGNDAVLEPWTALLWKSLSGYFPSIDCTDENLYNSFFPKWDISKNDHDVCERPNRANDLYFYDEQNLSAHAENPFIMELSANVRTTAPNHFQDVRLLEFNPVKEPFPEYKIGDVINVRPRNSKSQIDSFFKMFSNHDLNLHPDDVITVTQIHSDMPVPIFLQKPILLNQLVEQYWDLSAVPRKSVFSVLARVSDDKLEKNKCVEFCTSNGAEEFLNYCRRPKRNILEVLEDFHHSTSKLGLVHLFEIFTCIKPRSFSIASSCIASNRKSVDILVAVVKYSTKLKNSRLGLCSNWLKDLPIGMRIFGWITKGTFVFPNNTKIPLIMIGPGTGLAPFRSVILEKEYLGQASDESLILIFGCRNKTGDFHCVDYLTKMEDSKRLKLICAFSRDQGHKIYVQHKIKEHGKFLFRLINQNAHVFIAGNSKDMPDEVKSSFEQIISSEGEMNKEDAKKYLQNLINSNRFQLETW